MKTTSRILSLLLSLVMMFVFIPQGVLAEIGEALSSNAEDTQTIVDGSLLESEIEAETPIYVLGEDIDKRTATSKTFRMSDGSYIAADYGKTIHFKNENGEWTDYDNTLSSSDADSSDSEDFSGYETNSSDIKFKFANNSQSSNLLKITKGDYKISLHLVGADKSKAVEVYDPMEKNEGNDIESASTLNKFSSGSIYKDILPSTDLEYIVSGGSVKENIIVKEKCDSYEYTFELKLKGLIPVLLEDGSIALNDEKTAETQLIIPNGYMYDAEYESSSAVSYSIEHKNGKKYTLTVTADAEWINAEERVFPVTIDPTFEAFDNTYNTMDAHISEFTPGDVYYPGINPADPMIAGYSMYDETKECHILIRPYVLPSIPTSSAIVSAALYFHPRELVRDGNVYLAAKRITGDWTSQTVCWNTRPTYDDEILDYASITSNSLNEFLTFDVTRAVQEWYKSSEEYKGIAICPISGYGTGAIKVYSSDTNNSNENVKPQLIIAYRDTKGLENLWTYSSHNAGGTNGGYVNGFNGNLVVVHDDMATSDSLIPVNVSHVFNTYLANAQFNEGDSVNSPITANFDAMKIGYGWKLSVQETLIDKDIDSRFYYVYNDSDGTEHYFIQDSEDTNKYISEDGYDLTVTVSGDQKILADDVGNEKLFDSKGRLIQIEDANGNLKTFVYDTSNRLTAIKLKPVGGSEITQITFVYSGNVLSKIVNNQNTKETLEYKYSSTYNGTTLSNSTEGYLRTITYKYDGTTLGTTSYTYNSDGTLSTVSSQIEGVNRTTNYQYVTYNSFRHVSRIIQKTDNAQGQSIGYEYSDKKFTIRSSGNDDTYGNTDDILTHYLFDNFGRAICSYTTNLDKTETYGVAYQEYTPYESTAKTNNRITVDSAKGYDSTNYVANSSYESSFTSWSGAIASGCTGYTRTTDSTVSYYGTRSQKITSTESTSGFYAAYQDITIPSAGTYTLSAYVKTVDITTDVTNGGAFVMFGTDESQLLTGTTNTNIQDGWQRISVTKTFDSATTCRVEMKLRNCIGTAYFDCVQVEKFETPSSYNFICNGSFESASVWSGTYTVEENHGKLSANPSAETYIKQTVQLNKSANTTFMLTGWAKANSVYLYRTTDEEALSADTSHRYDRKFSLMAKLFYTDGTNEEFEADFNANNTNWQYVSTAVVPKKDVNYAEIYVLYDYNANAMYFDNIAFTAEPAQTYAYDDEGNLKLVTDIDGNDSLLTYAENGVDLEGYTAVTGEHYDYTYNAEHQVETAKRTVGSVTQTLTYDYDQYGRTTSSTLSAGGQRITSSVTYTDDFTGNISQITDSLGSVTNYSYDTLTKLLKYMENAKSVRTQYTYDTRKRVTSVYLDADEDSVFDEATEAYVEYVYASDKLQSIQTSSTEYTMSYDNYGNITGIQAGSYTLATYEYAPYNGKLLKLTYGNGDYEEYTYDHLDRLVKVLYNGTEEKYSIVYNANGGIHSITESGITHLYEYDSLGRLIRAWQKDSSGVTTLYVENSYDSLGRSSGSKYVINGETFNYSIAYKENSNNVARFYYPAMGGATKIQFYTYDQYDRLTKSDLLVDLTSKAYQAYEYYTYTVDGESRTTSLISKLTLTANGVNTVYEYTYDALGNITLISKDGAGIARYEYDSLNQLVREDDFANGYTYVYIYDKSGNLLEKRRYTFLSAPYSYIISATGIAYTVVASYGYSDSSWGDLLTNYNGTTITYDAIGNPLNWRNTAEMTWEGRQLTYHTNLDNTVRTNYAYNSEGIRTYKRVIDLTSSAEYNIYDYTLDGTKILAQHYRNNKTKEDSYLYFLYDETGSVSGFNDGTNTYFYQKNIQGDIIRILDTNGNVVVEYTYDAWGKILSVTGSLADTIGQKNPFRYRSYYYDSETGWYYLNSRYYDPEVGRFINADGIIGANGGLQGYNLFAYCNNNPVMGYDPYGTWTLGFSISGSAVFGIGINLGIGFVIDDNWNFDVQWTYSVPGCNDTFMVGGISAQASVSVQYTSADTVYDLYGPSSSAGFGVGNVGFDVISFSDASDPNKELDGVQISVGVGAGVDVHVVDSYTETVLENSNAENKVSSPPSINEHNDVHQLRQSLDEITEQFIQMLHSIIFE